MWRAPAEFYAADAAAWMVIIWRCQVTHMGDISMEIDPAEIRPNAEIRGVITVSYPGKYDGVVVSAQISDSNEHITYKSSNGKPISQNVARLFISRDSMKEGGPQGRVYGRNRV